MAGGPNDSSLTRVQPVFTRLAVLQDPSWVIRLLRLASRAPMVSIPDESGALLRLPVFEHQCHAPEDLLFWMIDNPSHVDWSRLETAKLEESTRDKRRELRDGNVVRREEALRSLQMHGSRARQWYVLEGPTAIDCALFCEHVTVFIEGKRTEDGLTRRVSWLRERDQVMRNLDCLRVEPARAGAWFALLIVDEHRPRTIADAHALDAGVAAVRGSFPHLLDDGAVELYSHYAGFTTWSAIEKEFFEVA